MVVHDVPPPNFEEAAKATQASCQLLQAWACWHWLAFGPFLGLSLRCASLIECCRTHVNVKVKVGHLSRYGQVVVKS